MITRLWNKFSETYWQYKFSGSMSVFLILMGL